MLGRDFSRGAMIESGRLKSFICTFSSTQLPVAPTVSRDAKLWAMTLKSLSKYLGHGEPSLSPTHRHSRGSAERSTSFARSSAGMEHHAFH